MDDFRRGLFDRNHQPVLQGVDALFSDFGGNCRQLDLDFAAEDFLLGGGGLSDPQQEAWDRNAALSNIASQGAAIRGLVTSGGQDYPKPAWKAWSPSDDPRMDTEQQSSADSLPSTSYLPVQQPPHQLQPTWQLPEIKAESSSRLEIEPEPQEGRKISARQAAQIERDRERAEKLKEKNKRAQRKFRQRQKDRQESAERLAVELAEQLQKVQLEKEALQKRNQVLESALGDEARSALETQSSEPKASPELGHPNPDQFMLPRAAKDAEPTFVPAQGWKVFDPTGGMVLVAVCQPPRKLTHRQMLSLSLRDMTKIMIELTRRLKECLNALEMESPNPTAEARIQALLWERHAIMAYLAVNKPKAVYQLLSSKMVDPPEGSECGPATHSQSIWKRVLDSMEMTEEQKRNVMEAREIYITKVGMMLLERHEIKQQLQELEVIPKTVESFRVPAIHLQWTDLASRLKANLDMVHRCNAYFMSRLWYRDCFTPVQVAKFITEAHPFPVDIFAIIKELVAKLGAPDYMQVLQKVYGNEKISAAATWPLDSYVDSWPAALVAEHADSHRQQQRTSDEVPDLQVANFSHRQPDDACIHAV